MSLARILIVEDEPSEILLLRRAFKMIGEDIEFEIAADGARALEFVNSARENPQEAQPCVILLDLHLPKHNGLEVLHAIRLEPVLCHIQVVVTTILASPGEEAKIVSLGAHFRLKPKDLAQYEDLALELMALCRGLLGVAVSAAP